MCKKKKKKKNENVSILLSSKLVTLSFVLRQMFDKGILIEAVPRVFRDLHKFFDLPMFSSNFVLKKSSFLLFN